mmetsp:Transcript_11896/g.18659  ORF Transcript_11896/g.18659 Transcript_11896/m.18659 type:complete len:230 (-) Transcript_11896:414-1103(-)
MLRCLDCRIRVNSLTISQFLVSPSLSPLCFLLLLLLSEFLNPLVRQRSLGLGLEMARKLLVLLLHIKIVQMDSCGNCRSGRPPAKRMLAVGNMQHVVDFLLTTLHDPHRSLLPLLGKIQLFLRQLLLLRHLLLEVFLCSLFSCLLNSFLPTGNEQLMSFFVIPSSLNPGRRFGCQQLLLLQQLFPPVLFLGLHCLLMKSHLLPRLLALLELLHMMLRILLSQLPQFGFL